MPAPSKETQLKLAHYWRTPDHPQYGHAGAHMYALEILANPQAHLDALVEAGVVRRLTYGWGFGDGPIFYELVTDD